MRISDWSSDVCSSDLVIVEILFDDRGVRRGEGDRLRPDLRRYVGKLLPRPAGGKGDLADVLNQRLPAIIDGDGQFALRIAPRRVLRRRRECRQNERNATIGRASCRERVGQYV